MVSRAKLRKGAECFPARTHQRECEGHGHQDRDDVDCQRSSIDRLRDGVERRHVLKSPSTRAYQPAGQHWSLRSKCQSGQYDISGAPRNLASYNTSHGRHAADTRENTAADTRRWRVQGSRPRRPEHVYHDPRGMEVSASPDRGTRPDRFRSKTPPRTRTTRHTFPIPFTHRRLRLLAGLRFGTACDRCATRTR